MLAEMAATVRRTPEVHWSGVVNPFDRSRRIRAVLFDLDGTLYRQRSMRIRMAVELAAFLVSRPLQGPKVASVLAEYRRAQERLRSDSDNGHPLRQAELTASRAGVSVSFVEGLVDEWMIERPLKHLPRCQVHGVAELLSFLNVRQVPTGVLSDYPATRKLEALGIAARFSLVFCAADPEIGAFKPHPRGFLAAAERWQLDPENILYVGDREDVDATGAAAAGMPCVIVTKSCVGASAGHLCVPTFERLRDVLDDHCGN